MDDERDDQLLSDLLNCPSGETDDDVIDALLDELSKPLPDDEEEE